MSIIDQLNRYIGFAWGVIVGISWFGNLWEDKNATYGLIIAGVLVVSLEVLLFFTKRHRKRREKS